MWKCHANLASLQLINYRLARLAIKSVYWSGIMCIIILEFNVNFNKNVCHFYTISFITLLLFYYSLNYSLAIYTGYISEKYFGEVLIICREEINGKKDKIEGSWLELTICILLKNPLYTFTTILPICLVIELTITNIIAKYDQNLKSTKKWLGHNIDQNL